MMDDPRLSPRPPWLIVRDATTPPPGSPAARLLREHLRHGSAARREAAAFALALTQPAAARAIADFFAVRRTGAARGE
jgi:hypothetical protein